MENEINTNATHIGRKIERIRRLRGMTQTDLGDLLGITKQAVLYYTNNFYENSNATATNIGTISNLENINHFSMEQAVKLFEELLKIEREKYNKENSKNDK